MTMDALARERVFARAVLDAEALVPSGLQGKKEHAPKRRFGVYRNNVYAGIVNVLAGRFPVCQKLVGDEFFRAMARSFVEEDPPRSAVLLTYGAGFADFIAGFPPAGAVPYLADIARLEWAWHEAYHAADAEPLDPEAMSALAVQAETTVLTLHPSLRIVRSAYPVITIWELAARDGEDEPVRLQAGGEDALVVRPALNVTVRRLPKGGAAFIQALQERVTLLTAATLTLEAEPAFDLAANLAGLMRSGAIVSGHNA